MAFGEEEIVRFLRHPTRANVPRCAACRGILRPHLLYFDEAYAEHADYEIERVREALQRAAVILCAGTSFSVGVTRQVEAEARARQLPFFDLDPGARSEVPGSIRIREGAETALPAVWAKLQGADEERR
jgi:NAD-dependent deacetylase